MAVCDGPIVLLWVDATEVSLVVVVGRRAFFGLCFGLYAEFFAVVFCFAIGLVRFLGRRPGCRLVIVRLRVFVETPARYERALCDALLRRLAYVCVSSSVSVLPASRATFRAEPRLPLGSGARAASSVSAASSPGDDPGGEDEAGGRWSPTGI